MVNVMLAIFYQDKKENSVRASTSNPHSSVHLVFGLLNSNLLSRLLLNTELFFFLTFINQFNTKRSRDLGAF